MIFDPSLWVFLAFLTLIFLVGRQSWQHLRHYLDQRAENIHNNIKAAQQLKEEAQFILNHALRLQKEMNDRSDEIIAHSEAEINRLKTEAQQQLDSYLALEESQLTTRLQQLEYEVLHQIEKKVVAMAFATAEQVITSYSNENIHISLFKKGIAEISRIPQSS